MRDRKYLVRKAEYDVVVQKTEGGARVYVIVNERKAETPTGGEYDMLHQLPEPKDEYHLWWNLAERRYMYTEEYQRLEREHPEIVSNIRSPLVSGDIINLLWAD